MNAMIAVYEALGGPWMLAAQVERALDADDDDESEMRADDDRFTRRFEDE